MHLATGNYNFNMTDPSISHVLFSASPGGIMYDGLWLPYDPAKDLYSNGTTCVVAGPPPGNVMVSTSPNTGGTYSAAP